ncbi:uncharacterized protein LOC144353214 [Saccoglossus kowalevskii]
MFPTLLFLGLIMLVVTSKGHQHPGHPADGTCMDCSDTMLDNGVWDSVCTENVACPDDIVDIENAIKGKTALLNVTYYLGNAAFVPGTQHYEFISILETQIDSYDESDIETVKVPTDTCDRCEGFVGDVWSQVVCKIVECPPPIAEYIEFKSTDPGKVTIKDRQCLISSTDEYYMETCGWHSDDPDFVNDVIEASP